MPPTFALLTTRLVSESIALANDALTLDCIGVIHGPNGTGKTESLRTIYTRFPTFSKQGTAFFHRACSVVGPTRGVKDLLVEVGLKGGHVSSMSLQLACKLALREFSSRNIRLLLIDEADSMAKDSLSGIITLVDYCNQHGHPLSLVMTAVQDVSTWFEPQRAGKSRTVRFVKASHLSLEDTLAILAEWVPELKDLISKAQQGDPAHLKLARLIFQASGDGNLRRLSYFSALLKSDNTFDSSAILSVISRITLGA